MPTSNTSRRRLLQAGTALGITALAGCSQVTSLSGGEDRGVPYTAWLPAPADLGDESHYEFIFIRPIEWTQYEDELDDEFYDDIEDSIETIVSDVNIDFDEIETAVFTVAQTLIVTHQREEAAIVERLEENEFEEERQAGEFTIYLAEEETMAAAVAGETFVLSLAGFTETGDPLEAVSIHLDTKRGDSDRYLDANQDMETLVDHLGSPGLVAGETHGGHEESDLPSGQFAGQVASGKTVEFGVEQSTFRSVRILDEADAIDEETARDWVNEDERFDDVDDPDVEFSGRRIIASGPVDTDDIGTEVL